MNQTGKLILTFAGAGLVGNLLARAIIASAPTPPTEPPRLFQAVTSLALVGGGAFAWSLRDDPFRDGKDMALGAAALAGASGGFLAATITMQTAPQLAQAQQTAAQLGGK